MSPEQALRAATETSAALLGWSGKVGSLSSGAYGDLVAVRGNPLGDIDAVERVEVVLKGGKVVRNEKR
jgi:imidazolonepropionase-like amidohydrolase